MRVQRRVTVGEGGWHPRPGLLLAVLVYCGLVVSVIGTLGTPLIPTIARAQHVSLTSAQWILTLTLLTGAVTTPLFGRLGDGAHRRTVLVAGLGTVAVGSVLAATAGTFPQLLVGRGLMGVGMGLMPLALAIARDLMPPARLGPAVAGLSITTATGAGLGYPLTGLLADAWDYHAGFWVAAILAAAAVVAVLVIVPAGGSATARRGRLDLWGVLLFAAALGPFLLGVSEAETWGWTSPGVLGLLGAGVVCAVAWTRLELRTEHPLIELKYLAARPVLIADVCAVLAGFGLYNAMTLINRLAQTPTSSGYGFGASPAVLGLVIVPLSIGTALAGRWARSLAPRIGAWGLMLSGQLAVGAGLFGLAASHDHLVELGCATFLFGFGIGFAFAAMPALIISAVPRHETGSATSFNQVLRTAGGALGSALGAALLAAHVPAGSALPTNHGYTVAFVVAGAVSVLAGLSALALRGSGSAAGTAGGTASAAGSTASLPTARQPRTGPQAEPDLTTRAEESTAAAVADVVLVEDCGHERRASA
ncbi:MFS transporter [Frankia sp. AiPs1]|uniref:MFS transporter n=1 Tax=Frankia sp. AiPa1 TaxID=573492 RepID=UPI00202B3DF8|nr:MFS transporter [Frankia sp. AiPa1]MCL9761689.1 MFS transporter [Frankia sp. AiPa1]